MRRIPAGDDYDAWVGLLAVSSRRQQARHHLRGTGVPAVPALRRGLRHAEPMVRAICASLLDQLLDDDAVPDLVATLHDDDPEVLKRALHALACDRCTLGECRPADDLFVPRAFELLDDPNPDVRAGAIDALVQVGKRDPAVRARLDDALARERHPGLRNLGGAPSAR